MKHEENDQIDDNPDEFRIEEMIFLEDNEIKKFFVQFFKVFKSNVNNNKLNIARVKLKDASRANKDYIDANKLSETISSNGIFKNRKYLVKYNENMVKPVEKALMSRRRARN